MIAAESIGAPPAAWRALVAAMARGIRHGQLGVEKVVLARAERVSASVDPATALARLAHEYPSCTIFAIGHGDGVFLGATPERLVQLRGGVAATMALAGSVGRGADPAADADLAARLLASPKDRAEHAIVVRAQRSALTEVCTSVVADAEPHVRKLSNVQHLLTPIRGQLRPDRGIFDLLERLHPTPAVGGFPRQRALELIRQHEQLDRGWYAGPIGWVNRAGEGEFVVAIRSALLRGKSATLFAGCGIVGDSDLTGEYAESKWKLRPMLAALGV
jgi:isochorismate synthase